MKEVAINLKALRIKAGMTQKELADELRVSLSTYSNWEALKKGRRTPTIEMLTKIADVLNVSLDDIVGR